MSLKWANLPFLVISRSAWYPFNRGANWIDDSPFINNETFPWTENSTDLGCMLLFIRIEFLVTEFGSKRSSYDTLSVTHLNTPGTSALFIIFNINSYNFEIFSSVSKYGSNKKNIKQQYFIQEHVQYLPRGDSSTVKITSKQFFKMK